MAGLAWNKEARLRYNMPLKPFFIFHPKPKAKGLLYLGRHSTGPYNGTKHWDLYVTPDYNTFYSLWDNDIDHYTVMPVQSAMEMAEKATLNGMKISGGMLHHPSIESYRRLMAGEIFDAKIRILKENWSNSTS